MTAQVVVSLSGVIYNVQLGNGRNNDQGMLRLTALDRFLEDNDLYWLADKGYHHHRLVTPNKENTRKWNEEQAGLRSVVEATFGNVQRFSLASSRVRQTPELQKTALMIIYTIVNRRLKQHPLRPLLHRSEVQVEEVEEESSDDDDDENILFERLL